MAAQAQHNIGQQTITWNSDYTVDVKSGKSASQTTTFVTHAGQSVDFIQGSKTRTFQVTATEGTWTDINYAGEITFNISYDGMNGTLTFRRVNEETTIVLDFTSQSPQAIRQRFVVNSFTIQ